MGKDKERREGNSNRGNNKKILKRERKKWKSQKNIISATSNFSGYDWALYLAFT